MANDYIPRSDREFETWLQNFLTMAEEFKAEAGLTPAEIAELADLTSNYVNALGTAETKRLESIAATREKDTTREIIEKRVRRTAERIKTSPTMTDTILISMNLTVPSRSHTSHSPQRPENLVAEMEAPGRVHLEWDAGGNTPGAQYIIEYQQGNSGEFTLADVVTRRSFTHTNVPAGARITYRVSARRNGELSMPSNLAAVE